MLPTVTATIDFLRSLIALTPLPQEGELQMAPWSLVQVTYLEIEARRDVPSDAGGKILSTEEATVELTTLSYTMSVSTMNNERLTWQQLSICATRLKLQNSSTHFLLLLRLLALQEKQRRIPSPKYLQEYSRIACSTNSPVNKSITTHDAVKRRLSRININKALTHTFSSDSSSLKS